MEAKPTMQQLVKDNCDGGFEVCDVIEVFPEASELNEIKNQIRCPEVGCSAVFSNSPNLALHLFKTHHRKDADLRRHTTANGVFRYYCPEAHCRYHFKPGSVGTRQRAGFFTKHKYLKQHYMKIHLEKRFLCDRCQKAFTTRLEHMRHIEVCGISYECSCSAVYKTYAALLTHARRKNHFVNKELVRSQRVCHDSDVLVETEPTADGEKTNEDPLARFRCQTARAEFSSVTKESSNVDKGDSCDIMVESKKIKRRKISGMVKRSDGLTVMAAVALSELSWRAVVRGIDKEVQTEVARKRRLGHAQTSGEKTAARCSAQTQTVGPYQGRQKATKRGKSTETQTCSPMKAFLTDYESGSNSPHLVNNDLVLPQLWLCSSSGTQTNKSNERLFSDEQMSQVNNIFVDSESSNENKFQEEIENLLRRKNRLFDENVDVCSTETQTEINHCQYADSKTQDDFLDQYSHTCTQTQDEAILSDLGLINIETQTAWSAFNEYSSFVSTETQTQCSFECSLLDYNLSL